MRLLAAEPHDFYSPLSVSGTIFSDIVFDGVGLVGFKSRVNAFHWPYTVARYLFVFHSFPFLFFVYIGWYRGAVIIELMGCK